MLQEAKPDISPYKILDSLPDHVAVLNAQGDIIFVNQAWRTFAQANGATQDFLHQNYLQVCETAARQGSANAQEVADGIRGIIAGRAEEFEGIYACHGLEEKRWFKTRIWPVTNLPQASVLVSHKNVTTQVIKEIKAVLPAIAQTDSLDGSPRSIAAYQHFTELIANTTPNLIYVHDLEKKRNVWVNEVLRRTLEDITATALSHPAGIDLMALIHPADLLAIQKRAAALKNMTTGEWLEVEYRLQTAQGTYRWFLDRAAVFKRNEQGQVIEIIGSALDITDRIEAQKALQRYERIVSATSDSIALVDNDYIYRAVNEAYLHRAGKSYEQVVGHTVAEVMGEVVYRTILKEKLDRCLRGETVRYQEWFDYNSDGRRFMDVTYAPDQGKNGNIKGILVSARDITQVKQAEEILRRRAQLLDAVGQAVIATDPAGRIEYLNAAAEQMSGWRRHEILGRDILTLLSVLGAREKAAHIVTRLTAGQPWSGEFFVRRKDGSEFPALVTEAPLLDPRGKLAGTVGIFTDLTDRNRAEEALQESRQLLAQTFFSLHDAVFILDYQTVRILDCNPAAERIFGYGRQEILGQTVDFLHVSRASLEEFRAYLYPAVNEQGFIADLQFRMKRKDGTVFPTEHTVVLNKDKAGKPTSWVSVVRDITERQQVLEALQESEQKFRHLAEQSPNLIFISVRKGRFAYINPEFVNVLGYSPAELYHPTFDWTVLVNEDHLGKVQENLRDLMKGMTIPTVEIVLCAKNGQPIKVLLTAKQIDFEGRPAVLGVITDITEFKRLEEVVRQSQKMEAIGTLAGGIAHDFNNILTPILGYAELTKETIPPSSMAYKNLELIINAGIRAKDLVQQILTFSRQLQNEASPVAVDLLISEALKLLRSFIPSTIRLRQYIQKGCYVLADPGQIHQIIVNLCTNAYQAIGENHGKIEVKLSEVNIRDEDSTVINPLPDGKYVKLMVQDTGRGIAEPIGRIFEPFYTTKAPGQGTGLGLAVVHGIVKGLGGAIDVWSLPDQGSIFTVYLPSCSRPVDQTPKKNEPLPGGTDRILLIDDDRAVLMVLKVMLETYGYRVTEFHNSALAMERFYQSPDQFDLLIVDQVMPDITGDEFVLKAQLIRPKLPVLMISGFSEVMSPERAMELGVGEFLYKPFDQRTLLQTVRHLLDGS